MLATCGDVEVGGEHARGHVAHLGSDDVPRAGVELLLHAVLGELDHAARHVLCLVAVVAPDGADPGCTLDQLGDVPLVVERVKVLEELVLATGARRAVHHVGDLGYLLGAILPVVIEDAHHLKNVGREGRDGPQAVAVRLLLGNDLAKRRLHAPVRGDMLEQCHVLSFLGCRVCTPPLSLPHRQGHPSRTMLIVRCVACFAQAQARRAIVEKPIRFVGCTSSCSAYRYRRPCCSHERIAHGNTMRSTRDRRASCV